MRVALALMLGVALLTHATALPNEPDLSPFPFNLQHSLRSLHGLLPGQAKKRGGSGTKQFALADDVHILMEHVANGVRLSQITAAGRKGEPVRDRHKNYLKGLPGYSAFLAASHGANNANLRERLHACDFVLPDGVMDDLVILHTKDTRAQTKSPWVIEDDGRLLEAFFANTCHFYCETDADLSTHSRARGEALQCSNDGRAQQPVSGSIRGVYV